MTRVRFQSLVLVTASCVAIWGSSLVSSAQPTYGAKVRNENGISVPLRVEDAGRQVVEKNSIQRLASRNTPVTPQVPPAVAPRAIRISSTFTSSTYTSSTSTIAAAPAPQVASIEQQRRNRNLQLNIPGIGGIGNQRTSAPSPQPLTDDTSATTDSNTDADEVSNTGELIFFILDYGFEAGTNERDPFLEDIDALVCVTLDWIRDRVESEGLSLFRQFGGDSTSPQVSVQAYHISWKYTKAADLPVEVTFFADVRTSNNDSPVLAEVVFKAFDLKTEEIASYITNYVWLVPQSNLFYFTNRVDYLVRKDETFPPVKPTKVLQSNCAQGETQAPSLLPATATPLEVTTLAPATTATQPPTIVETLAPTTLAPGVTITESPTAIPVVMEPATPVPGGDEPPTMTPTTTVPQPGDGGQQPMAPTPAPDINAQPGQGQTLQPTTNTNTTSVPVSGGDDGGESPQAPGGTTPSPVTFGGQTPAESQSPGTTAPSPATPGGFGGQTPAESQSPGTAPTSATPSESPGIPSPTNSTSATPQPPQPTSPGFVSLPKEPISFEMTFVFEDPEYTDRQPNKQDVQEVMCKTRIYLEERLKVATSETTREINVKITNIDWELSGILPDETSRLVLNMTATAMYTAETSEEPVLPQVIVAALYEMNVELLDYIIIPSIPAAEADRPPTDAEGNNIFDRDDFMFAHATELSVVDFPVGTTLVSGKLRAIGCGERIFEDPPAPTLGEAIDLNNLPGPGLNTNADSNNIDESDTGGGGDNTGGGGGDNTTTGGDSNANDDGVPSSAGPTEAPGIVPTIGSEPPQSQSPASGVKRAGQVEVNFIVSNLVFITIPNEVNRSGLSTAFPIFVDELISTGTPSSRRQLLRPERQLSVNVQPGSAYVAQLTRTSCGEHVHPDLVCHEAQAFYSLQDDDGATPVDESKYTSETYKAIHDGTLFNVMKREDPGTPLFIGTVLPTSASGGSDGRDVLPWVLIGIISFLLLCIFCFCWYVMHQRQLYEDALDYERSLSDEKPRGLDHNNHYPNTNGSTGPTSEPRLLDDDEGEEGFMDEHDAFVDGYTDLDFVDDEAYLLSLADADPSRSTTTTRDIKEKDKSRKNGDDSGETLLCGNGTTNPPGGDDAPGVFEDGEVDDEEELLLHDSTNNNFQDGSRTAPSTPPSDDGSREISEGNKVRDGGDSSWKGYQNNDDIEIVFGGDESNSSNQRSEGMDWENYENNQAVTKKSTNVFDDPEDQSEEEEDMTWEDYDANDAAKREFAAAPAVVEGEQDESDDDVSWEDYNGDEPAGDSAGAVIDVSSSSEGGDVDWEDYGGGQASPSQTNIVGKTTGSRMQVVESDDSDEVDWEDYE